MGKKTHGDHDARMAQLHTEIESLRNEVKRLTDERTKAVSLALERQTDLAIARAFIDRLAKAVDAQSERTVLNLKVCAKYEAMLDVHKIDHKTGRRTDPDFDYALAG